MALSAIMFLVLSTRLAIVNRMGYYTYFFALTLITRSMTYIPPRDRIIVRTIVLGITVLFFSIFAYNAGIQSYGVVPYKFFWQ